MHSSLHYGNGVPLLRSSHTVDLRHCAGRLDEGCTQHHRCADQDGSRHVVDEQEQIVPFVGGDL
ncbi:MAG: hypothetical protein LV473_10530 [Nitrospira sp.]|nr:hypothetical protein [Nitrospira sp.]